ncbi:MAG: hypothetical protein IT565_09820 [Rhodospirillales bacterium]|nr:hypothetical protein [Rhodospirillales bacterium]
MTLDAAAVKTMARELGADLVGIASAKALNAHPPDPRFPQTPERISPYCKSVIVIVSRVPAAAYRCDTLPAIQYLTGMTTRRMDRIAYKLADALERQGHPSFTTAAQETNWNFKNGTYGYLSTRHLGIEAGLGTFGLGVNILTPELGPRLYLTGVLTELDLEPDPMLTEQVCIGEGCSLCLYGCPTDAVGHFGLNKAQCSTKAQEFGYARLTRFFADYVRAKAEDKMAFFRTGEAYGMWQGMMRVVGVFGACPRCHATCPIGHDYHAFLAEAQKVIPEKTAEKVERGKSMRQARAEGQPIPGLNDWNIRWVGPDGYTGAAALDHLKRFKRDQEAKAQADQRPLVAEAPRTGKAGAVVIHKRLLTAQQIKDKARELGADLVGIADGAVMNANPPDRADPRRPQDITTRDGKRAIVLARRLASGTTRLSAWDERTKLYNDEIVLTLLEEASLKLTLWLEDQGYPSLIVPPTHVDPWRFTGADDRPMTPLLSATHAAVEAGLGTLGLNRQLITPEYGPRVRLAVLLSSVEVEPDAKMETALCAGPACGRCLKACPADAVGHWDRDFAGCDRYRAPNGYRKLVDYLGRMVEAGDADRQKAMLRTREGFDIFQSLLRGIGAITGCRRCEDVCPIGADYEAMLKDALDPIAETTPAKEKRLAEFVMAPTPPTYTDQARWIGRLADPR